MFIPRVKSENLSGGARKLTFPINIYLADKPSCDTLAVLSEFLPYATFNQVEEKDSADMIFSVRPGISEKKEYYEISSTESCFAATAKDKRGLINAAATLTQMISYENGEFTIALGEISDWPDKEFRCYMEDTGRKYIPIDEFRAHILLLAKAKMNKFHWHLMDSQGYSIAFEACEGVQSPDKDGRKYSKDEVKELIEYASLFEIDIIPELDIPGHGRALLETHPELACDVKTGTLHGWALCAGSEKTYEFISKLFAEVASLFPFDYIHIGTDEIDVRDHTEALRQPHHDWDDCEVCKKKFAPLGYKTTTEKFYYFVRRVYDIVTSLGKKVMMWNDNIDIAKSPDLPRDILIDFWHVAHPNRGPREGCSMLRFLEEGFEVLNSFCTFGYFYNTKHGRWNWVKPWNIDQQPAHHDGRYSHQIIGGKACAWEDFPHYNHSIPSAVSVYADRFYNLHAIDDEENFGIALTKFLLGVSCPKGLNIYGNKYLRAFYHLTTEISLFSDTCDKDEFKELLNSLTNLLSFEKGFVDAVLSNFDKALSAEQQSVMEP